MRIVDDIAGAFDLIDGALSAIGRWRPTKARNKKARWQGGRIRVLVPHPDADIRKKREDVPYVMDVEDFLNDHGVVVWPGWGWSSQWLVADVRESQRDMLESLVGLPKGASEVQVVSNDQMRGWRTRWKDRKVPWWHVRRLKWRIMSWL